MSHFEQVIDLYRKHSYSEADKGRRFERLMQAFLQTEPLYANELEHVWLWNEFPFRNSISQHDTGIDLVAQTRSGEYWAVQCKCYRADARIEKSDVDTFLSTSARAFSDQDGNTQHFAFRIWVDTTLGGFTAHAAESFKGQQIPASVLHFGDLAAAAVDWEELDKGINGRKAVTTHKQVKPHQEEAINAARTYFQDHDRGKLIMACGTGKTFTSLRIAEQMAGESGKVLFLVPSIALLGQTLREWSHDAAHPLRPMCVCSDSEVSQSRSKNDDTDLATVDDLAFPASTRVAEIQQQYTLLRDREGMLVVFSTYQSIERIAAAQKAIGEELTFDLIICDEAHRTTGVTLKGDDESAFVRVHNNDFIRAEKRLYMTATPRLYREADQQKAREQEAYLCSMDDPEIYGEEIYRLGFGEAVDKHLLSDYKVLILSVEQEDVSNNVRRALMGMEEQYRKEIDTDDMAKLIGCINALSKRTLHDNQLLNHIDPKLMHRAVAFCRTIKDSRAIAQAFNACRDAYFDELSEHEREELVQVEARHVDGSMGASKRDALLQWLKQTRTDHRDCHLLTNVRCLSEGVDVPSLDAILFLSAKNSQVDVVQSVGRVMRRAEGKKYGYIIIPIVVPSDVAPEDALNDNKTYAVVWDILNALRAHDDRFNAMVNKIELNKKRPDFVQVISPGSRRIGYGGGGSERETSRLEEERAAYNANVNPIVEQMSLRFEQLQNALYARMVQKVGSKRYWEQWAADISKIAERHIAQINRLIAEDSHARKAFDSFMRGLHKDINPSVSEAQAVEMLAQHIITQPVFEALFENYEFAKQNPVSKAMSRIVELLNDKMNEADLKSLEKFYDSVRMRAEDIDNAEAKQKIVVELYDKFFTTAFPKVKEQLGIVYTPVEVVDFIIHSVEHVLQEQFGRSLADRKVNIIDPFTGTGTFITRLLQSGIIPPDRLEDKYRHEIFANEIVLLAYYIASVNIENVYHDLMESSASSQMQVKESSASSQMQVKESSAFSQMNGAPQMQSTYTPFPGICLTDTFQIGEQMYARERDQKYGKQREVEGMESPFVENSKRVQRQLDTPITVIIGNPPYSIGQKSANDNAENQHYPYLEERIQKLYVEGSEATSNKATYDSYIKAFRYATDRLSENGIIAFVSNGSWLETTAFDIFRKSIEQEFAEIYVFNLRGNQRTSGELSRREGGKIFGSGSRTPVSITLLVKKYHQGKAVIHYHDIGDYLSREQKLSIIRKAHSIGALQMEILHPNEHGDWINHRNNNFSNYIPIEPEKKFVHNAKSFFYAYSLGLATHRDSFVYNYSIKILQNSIDSMMNVYNQQRKERKIYNEKGKLSEWVEETNEEKIIWATNLRKACLNNTPISVDYNNVITAMYRPFCHQNLYYSDILVDVMYMNKRLFPSPNHKNLVINIIGVGVPKDFACILSDCVTDLNIQTASQNFPLYYYEKRAVAQGDLFDQGEDEYIRHEAVTDFILKRAREQYGPKVTKEDIFYYVYGFLHCPGYRETFANDLKKMLPRLPLVEKPDDFWAFSRAGRALADLHLHYETVEACPEVEVTDTFSGTVGTNNDSPAHFRVEQMRFGKGVDKEKDRSVIVYNPHITLRNIPLRAYDYVVNGKSAIEWVMERYCDKTDKKSGIRNDANQWGIEHGNPRYPLDLLLSIISLSLKTLDIVDGLPSVVF